MTYIAHIRGSDKQVQSVEEHLLEVKKLAEIYGEKLGLKHLAGLAGILHDLGKFTNVFKEYIIEAVDNPGAPPKRGSVDHSTAGGRLLYEFFHAEGIHKGLVAEIVGNSIISHHSYLQDFLSPELDSNYLYRVRDKTAKELDEFEMSKALFFEHVMNEEDFRRYVDQAAAELEQFMSHEAFGKIEKKIMYITKFVFSALIDADRTNTRLFEENKTSESSIDTRHLFDKYYDSLLAKINAFPVDSPINKLRGEMSDQCDQCALKPSGIYTLSIPTGGGKTLASLRYALKHAKIFNKKRIVYVVPFTTIIEQNAEEVRNILKDDANILEHHSNVVADDQNETENINDEMDVRKKLKLARDNWDSPIIFTTMVQFLNAFYAKGNRNTRRLHNLSETVLIFDEVQKVPIPCVSLFNDALNFLKRYGQASVVLCTATQPALEFVENKLEISPDAEIIQNLDQVLESFKRVEIIDQATKESFTNDKLTEFIDLKMGEMESILVILNTKSVVKDLYARLKENMSSIPVYHLSTSMCAVHRNSILKKVRQLLKDGEKVICISTQLIEAGVDVSFDCVIRSLAGLDSIAQAAGRCNRHGEKYIGTVYIVDHVEENLTHLKEIRVGKELTKKILIDIQKNPKHHGGHILSLQAMDRYFKAFYTEFDSELDYFIPKVEKRMVDLLTETKSNNSYHKAYCRREGHPLPLYLANSYKTAADHFHVIEEFTTSVIVPYKEGTDIITELNGQGSIEEITQLLRKAQQFSINISNFEREQLIENEGLVSLFDGRVLALKDGAYSEEFGLNIKNDSQPSLLIM
jgi:CRISPR-associated endonuclease/helicase Cas3